MHPSIRNKLLIAALATMLGACASTQTPDSGVPVEDRNATTGNTTPGASTSGAGSGAVTGSATSPARGGNPLRDPSSPLSRRTVFFDYDSDVVKDEFRPLIEAHARYLQTNRNQRLTIQGNTDERGSREYNIALGQRRADAAKKMMQLMGATDAQIETVSFGKEKPHNPGHDESAWAENRRDDILYSGE